MSSSINFNNNSNEIKWESIFLIKEFQYYLELEELKEISLLSKLMRLKLRSNLFENIKLNGRNFEVYFNNGKNIIWEYFDLLRFIMGWNNVEDFDDTHCKELKVQPAYKEFEDQLSGFKQLVTSLNFSDIGSAGYYLLPLSNLFINLTTLKITNCTISLLEFNALLNSLTKLNSIKLIYTMFAKLPTEKFSLKDVEFPKTLTNLSIFECQTMENELIRDPYEFLFDKLYSGSTEDFILPPTPIPSLKKLSFLPPYYNINGLNQFLSCNNQLEFLNFKSSALDQFKVDYFKDSKCLSKLEIICDNEVFYEVNIPTLNSIKELQIQYLNQKVFNIIRDLCVNSINLNNLTFILDTDDELVNIINLTLTDIIAKCYSLKELALWIFGSSTEKLNFNKLNNIEVLLIHSDIQTILSLEFQNSKNLKKLSLSWNETDMELDTIKEKFETIKGWNFKINNDNAEGIKL